MSVLDSLKKPDNCPNVPSEYEVVCQTEYQDIYRLKYGVLLVVDKFSEYDEDGVRGSYLWPPDNGHPYNKKTESKLRSSKQTGKVYYNDWEVFIEKPVNYKYKLKTSGDYFSGNIYDFSRLILDVQRIVRCYAEMGQLIF